jgi:hypothetical protein
MIVFSFEHPSLLHVLSSSMFVILHLCELVNNDDIHQGLEVIFNEKDMHLLLSVAREKVGGSL